MMTSKYPSQYDRTQSNGYYGIESFVNPNDQPQENVLKSGDLDAARTKETLQQI